MPRYLHIVIGLFQITAFHSENIQLHVNNKLKNVRRTPIQISEYSCEMLLIDIKSELSNKIYEIKHMIDPVEHFTNCFSCNFVQFPAHYPDKSSQKIYKYKIPFLYQRIFKVFERNVSIIGQNTTFVKFSNH